MKHHIGMVCGHAGYITGLFEYVMTDMLWLRVFAFAGCALIVGYQAVQPKIQWVSTGWNTIFCMMNLYHIRLLRQAEPRKLVEDELELHQVLGEHLASRSQVLSLLEEGVWQTLAPGSVIVEEGRTTDEMQVLIIVRGGCDIYIKGFRMGRLQPGSAVGFELAALRALEGGGSRERDEEGRGASAAATIVVDNHSEALCLRVPWARLIAEPSLLEVLRMSTTRSLAAQVAASDSAARLLEYGAVLEMTCYASQAAANTAAAPSSRRTMSRIWPPVPLPSEPAPVSSVSKLEESLRQARLRLGITPQEHCRVAETLPDQCRTSQLLG